MLAEVEAVEKEEVEEVEVVSNVMKSFFAQKVWKWNLC